MSGRWMTTAALVLAGVTGVGCVSEQRFNEAVDASRQAHAELQKGLVALEAARGENQNLRADLAKSQAEIQTGKKLAENLRMEKDLLDASLTQALAKYEALLRERPVPVFGPIQVPPRVDAALQALAKDNAELMDYLPKYGMIKFKSDLAFAKGSAIVKPAAAETLRKFAAIVNAPEALGFHVYVAGHTDDIPLKKRPTIEAHGSNWGLSAHRALRVIEVLARAGIKQHRMGGVAFSKHHPIAPNAPDEKGNPANRRVEIWIVPPNRFLTVPGPESAAPSK